jgi:hypothetical protein
LIDVFIERNTAGMRKAPTRATLRQFREWRTLTQVEVAKRLDVPQGEVSKIERRPNHRVSSLAAYVAALGGRLELVAVVGGKRIRLVEG